MMRALTHGLEVVGETLCGLPLRDSNGTDRDLRYLCLIPGRREMFERLTCKKCRQQKGLT